MSWSLFWVFCVILFVLQSGKYFVVDCLYRRRKFSGNFGLHGLDDGELVIPLSEGPLDCRRAFERRNEPIFEDHHEWFFLAFSGSLNRPIDCWSMIRPVGVSAKTESRAGRHPLQRLPISQWQSRFDYSSVRLFSHLGLSQRQSATNLGTSCGRDEVGLWNVRGREFSSPHPVLS